MHFLSNECFSSWNLCKHFLRIVEKNAGRNYYPLFLANAFAWRWMAETPKGLANKEYKWNIDALGFLKNNEFFRIQKMQNWNAQKSCTTHRN